MKITTRHIIAGLAAATALGGAAATASAAPALPDLAPYIEQTDDNPDFPAKWFVELAPGGQKLLHFPARIVNNGPGTFEIGADGTDALARLFPFDVFDKELRARQILTGPTPADTETRSLDPGSYRLVGDQFGNSDTWYWRTSGLARYTLQPAAGALIESGLGLSYWNDEFVPNPAPPPAPPEIDPNNTSDANASTFSPTIKAGSGDSYPLNRAVTEIPLDNNVFDVTGARPGPATFTAQVLPGGATTNPAEAGKVLESNVGNNTRTANLVIPGVLAPGAAASTSSQTAVNIPLSASSVGAATPIKRPTDAGPAPVAPGALTYAINGLGPGEGTATVSGRTVRFTPAVGFTGIASFGYTATESGRGFSASGPITVTVRPGGGTGGPDRPPGRPVVKVKITLKPTFGIVRIKGRVFLTVKARVSTRLAGRRIAVEQLIGKRRKVIARLKVAKNGTVSGRIRIAGTTVKVRFNVAAGPTTRAAVSAFKTLRVPKARR